ncbi:MAG: hypothetical protein WCO23_00535 [bacterium]
MIDYILEIEETMSVLGLEIREVTLFKYGLSQSTYKITAKTGIFVIKLFDRGLGSLIQNEINNLRRISRHCEFCVRSINEKILEVGDKIGYYYQYFDGKKISSLKIDNIYFRFGELAARFDIALSELDFQKSEFAPKSLLSTFAEVQCIEMFSNDPTIISLVKRGCQILKTNKNYLDFSKVGIQYIHKDLHFDNVIYCKKTNNFFIIDTTGLRVHFLPKELAVIIGNEFWSDKVEYKKIDDLLSGYLGLIRLNKTELSSIPLFIIDKKIGELKFLQTQYINGKLCEAMYFKHIKLSSRNLGSIIDNFSVIQNYLEKYSED